MSDQTYDSQTQEIFDSKLGRVALKSNLRRMVIACDNALNEAPFRVRGDMVWFDQNTSAAGAVMKLNNTSEDPLPIAPLGGVLDYPITDVFVTCTAQPGKVINLWYGYRARFISPVSLTDISDRAGRLLGIVSGALGSLAQAVIGGANALVTTDRGYAYGASFASTTALANTATEQIFAAVTNPNGCIVWNVDMEASPTAVGFCITALHAHTVAPAALTDGNVLLKFMSVAATLAGQISQRARLERAVFVPAGKGLWFRSQGSSNEGNAARTVLYTLL